MFTQFKRLTWNAGLLVTLVSLLGTTIALAASGDLDTTFDGDGLVITNVHATYSDTVGGIAIQTDGKIVAAGGFGKGIGVVRYNTDGSLDTTFSGDGRVTTWFGGVTGGENVALQSNGKIVVSGGGCAAPGMIGACDAIMARYNPDGALDSTFSGDGKQTTHFGSGANGSGSGLVIQSNGKIVSGGIMSNGTDFDFAVYRYLSNGNLDTTFSGDGMVNISFGAGWDDNARDLVIQSDGKIIVAGYTDSGSAWTNFAIARLNENGTLDNSFSGDGRQTTNFGSDEYGNAVALQADGKIVVAGEKRANRSYFAIARYNTDGSLDTTFNGTGRRAFSVITGSHSWPYDVIVQPDGKIIVVGSTYGGTSLDFAIVRLNPGGAFDTTFSGDGKVTVDFGGSDNGYALALQSDGKYVLGGEFYYNLQGDFALARVLP